MKKYTIDQIHNKYKGKYINFYACPHWDTDKNNNALYEVRKVYRSIHENTTRG